METKGAKALLQALIAEQAAMDRRAIEIDDACAELLMNDRILPDGLHVARCAREPLEAAFAEWWREQNARNQTLPWLLSPAGAMHVTVSTVRDFEVASTIIQWLGSPVGSASLAAFLRTQPEFMALLK